MQKKLSIILLLLILVLLPTHTLLAQPTQVCKKADKCQIEEVGPFMVDISKDCGNKGDCTIADIVTVFNNVGNWILGVVGALVFLMYVWGGIQWLTSQGSPEKIGQGKKIIKTATIGLLIVFVANIAITTLEGTLRGSGGLGGATVPCTQDNEGQECGKNKVCSKAGCFSKCITQHLNDPQSWACMDVTGLESSTVSTYCKTNLCPGADTNVCCQRENIAEIRSRKDGYTAPPSDDERFFGL